MIALKEGHGISLEESPLQEKPPQAELRSTQRDDGLFGPLSGSDAEAVFSGKKTQGPCSESTQEWLITEELAASFTEVLNVANDDQLSVVISSSMQQDPQRIVEFLQLAWKKNLKRLHFIFRVEDGDVGNGEFSIVSAKGRNWGYLSFSTDFTCTLYGGFGCLPRNLLKFFLPIIKEVASLNSMPMARNPPRPVVIPFQRKGMEGGSTGK